MARKFATRALCAAQPGPVEIVDDPRGAILRRNGTDIAIIDVEAANAIATSREAGFIVEATITLVEDGVAYGEIATRDRRWFEGAFRFGSPRRTTIALSCVALMIVYMIVVFILI